MRGGTKAEINAALHAAGLRQLQAPLATVTKMARSLIAEDPYSGMDRELRVIASESAKASEIVTRLVSFGGGDQVEAKAVDVTALLRSLIEFREREWKVRGCCCSPRTRP